MRASGIGDFVFALPALEGLRAAYPDAEIVLLGLDWHAGLFAGRPAPIDRVEVVPPCRGVSLRDDTDAADDRAAVERFLARMRGERFDLAVQMHGGGRFSNPFVRALGARVTVGLRSPDAEPLDVWSSYVYFQSEIARCLQVAALAGARDAPLEPRLAVVPADLDASRALVPDDDRPLAVIHPGAGDPRRHWPPASFAAVADRLAEDGFRVVLNGVEREREATAAVRSAMRCEATDLTGRLSLPALVGLLSRARLAVGNDSGPLHLAAAVGSRTVGIFWCGNAITAGVLTRGRHRPVLGWRVHCPVCGAHCIGPGCTHDASFVADVPVAEVLDACRAVLDETAGEVGVRLHLDDAAGRHSWTGTERPS